MTSPFLPRTSSLTSRGPARFVPGASELFLIYIRKEIGKASKGRHLLSGKGVPHLVRAHSGALHPTVKEVSCRPSTALPPRAKHSSKDCPVLFLSPLGPQTPPPCQRPTDSPPPSSSPHRCPSPRGWGGLRQGTEDERTRSERGRPRLFTVRSSSPW